MPDIERLYQLLHQVQTHQASDSEYQELLSLIQDDASGEVVSAMDAWHNRQETQAPVPAYNPEHWKPVIQQVLAADKPTQVPTEKMDHSLQEDPFATPPRRITPRIWWAAAAGIALLLYTGSRFWKPATSNTNTVATTAPKKDFSPGGNRAMLTLADGTQIPLDSAGNGLLAQQGTTSIRKLANGQIVYEGAGTKDGKLLYNTMSTPAGGQYKLMLPDGTLVWLNASSSITYPTAFVEKNRKVTITGEAYFEIAQNASQPFVVDAGNTSISVLGTNFNVNAYTNEKTVSTTLLQGAVKVSTGSQQQLLQPGQQSNTDAGGNIRLTEHVNTQQTIAWKEGFFSFENADLPTVMRQLARWYDVEVVYEGKVPVRSFNGEIGRNLTLAQVLKGLSSTRINYRIENNNTIVILP